MGTADTAEVDDTDLDGDGWSVGAGDCDDTDPEVFPGAPEESGDGEDADCDGWDALPLAAERGVTADPALAPLLYGLQFGHVLDAADVDSDGDAEVLAGSQHALYSVFGQGFVALLDGPTLEPVGSWHGTFEDGESVYAGRSVAVLTAEDRVQVVFNELFFGVWILDSTAPSGLAEDAGGVYIDNVQSDDIGLGSRMTAVDGIGTPDEDLVVECSVGYEPGRGQVCVFEGPILADDTLPNADLVVDGGAGLGSGLGGADVDGDGRGDLVLGASNAAEDHGEVSVLLGPVPAGTVLTEDARASWVGENPGDWLGQVVTTGDLDDDGVDEAVGSAMAWPNNDRRGRVYGLPLEAATVAEASFVVDGDDRPQHLGMGMATGDLDGDGRDDLALGGPAMPVDPSVPGEVFVFFGPVVGPLTTSDANVVYVGEAPGDGAGVAVAIGDLDGSGVADLVVSAPYNDEADLDAGKIYLLFGPLAP